MHSVHFTAETSSNGVIERDFTVGGVPGVLWSPTCAPEHTALVLQGHGGGLHKRAPGLVADVFEVFGTVDARVATFREVLAQ